MKYFFLGEIPCQSDSKYFFCKVVFDDLMILIFCHLVALSVILFFKGVFAAPDLNMLSLVCSFCNLVFFKVIFDATNPCAADHRHRPHPLLLDGLPGGRTAAQGK